MTAVGFGLKFADTLASWFLSEDGYAEWALQRYAKKVEADAITAIRKKDFRAADERLAILRRMSSEA